MKPDWKIDSPICTVGCIVEHIGRKIAKVAMARKLAVHLYWMWRRGWDYEQSKSFGSS
jgi:hypothetical protein